MPIFFTEDTFAWLKGSFSLQKIADRIDALRREYDNIRRAVPEFAKFRHDEFVWARLVVITRIFGLVIGGTKTDGLVPFADMLNHKRPRETKWTFDDPRSGFIITTLRTIQRGDQVYDSYGRKCNSRFFVNYGFAIEENDDNEAVIRVEVSKNDPLYRVKVQRYLEGREILCRREYQIPASYKEKKCKELFSFLRFAQANHVDVQKLDPNNFRVEEIEPLSIQNEIATLKTLAERAKVSLAQFDHSLQHDVDLLKSDKLALYSPERTCCIMRKGEKEVLNWFVELAHKSIPLLQLPWRELSKALTRLSVSSVNERFEFYITTVVAELVKNSP